jgi:hypothetical protein
MMKKINDVWGSLTKFEVLFVLSGVALMIVALINDALPLLIAGFGILVLVFLLRKRQEN